MSRLVPPHGCEDAFEITFAFPHSLMVLLVWRLVRDEFRSTETQLYVQKFSVLDLTSKRMHHRLSRRDMTTAVVRWRTPLRGRVGRYTFNRVNKHFRWKVTTAGKTTTATERAAIIVNYLVLLPVPGMNESDWDRSSGGGLFHLMRSVI